MGEKRVSVRTIQGGWRVKDFPPDAEHPNGHQELIRDRSPLREKLLATRDIKRERHGVIHQHHLQAIEFKKAVQQVNGLPPEKSPI